MALRTFAGTIDGDLSTAGNWDTAPGPTDTAQLGTGAGLINLPSSGTLTCVSLDGHGENIAGGTYNCAVDNVCPVGPCTFNGALTNVPTIASDFAIGATGTFTWAGAATISSASTITNSGTVTMTAATMGVSDGNLTITGTGAINGTVAVDNQTGTVSQFLTLTGPMNVTATYAGLYNWGSTYWAALSLNPTGTSTVAVGPAADAYADCVSVVIASAAGSTVTVTQLETAGQCAQASGYADCYPTIKLDASLGTVQVANGATFNPTVFDGTVVLLGTVTVPRSELTGGMGYGEILHPYDAAARIALKADQVCNGTSSTDVPAAANVATGSGTYDRGTKTPSYPTTATTQAADAAIITAGKANVVSGTTFTFGASSSAAGTYPTTATTTAAVNASDAATLDAAKADIKNTRTITFGAATPVVGTLDITADNDDPVTLSTGYARRA